MGRPIKGSTIVLNSDGETAPITLHAGARFLCANAVTHSTYPLGRQIGIPQNRQDDFSSDARTNQCQSQILG
jgi:hypothetical protein